MLFRSLAGAVRPDRGVVEIDGTPVRFANTSDAREAGVAIVSQELTVFPELDVLSNLFARPPSRLRGLTTNRTEMRRRATPVLDELGLDVEFRQPVSELTLGQRQQLEIARALIAEPKILILDEPTSALHPREVDRLHGVLEALTRRQVAEIGRAHV